MNKIIAYINDNRIQIKNKNIICFNSKGILNGKIIDKNEFIKDYIKNVKKNNIFASDILIYLNKEIQEEDNIYYSYVFEDLNYNKIILQNTKKFLEDNTLIINNDYYIIYHDNKYYYVYINLLNEFLKTNNIDKIKVIGDKIINDNINCKFYYYNNYNNYFLSEN